MGRTHARLFAVGVAVIGLAFAVGGCREEEQDRILRFQKGTYLGEPDTRLSPQVVDALNGRAAVQKF